MISYFIQTYKRLLNSIQYPHHRYLFDSFRLDSRLTGVIGPRGTGKTTLLLQYIKEKMENPDDCIYVSMDHIYFSNGLLIEFVNELLEEHGVHYFFLDEIHKYTNWNQELKNIYDAYPDVWIVFSGSSSIDLVRESHDLSRRGVLYRLEGLSFREYLLFNNVVDMAPVQLNILLNNHSDISAQTVGINKIKGHFKNYLGRGYYPFHLEGTATYHQKILRVVEKTVFEDIANFYKLKTENLHFFKRIISYLSTVPPGELNRNSIAKTLGLDHKTVQNYLNILNESGLAELVKKNKSGGGLLKQTEKIYLDNPDIYAAVSDETGFSSQLGTIREIFFIRMIQNSGHKIHYSDTGDFEVNGLFFEIGGKNKGKKQIKGHLDQAFLVKDDILFSSRYEIPLFLFGFLY